MAYALVFNGPGNPNTISRIALSLSIIEEGTLHIDELAPLTLDKSRAGEHYASDKAPGMSFLALPAVYLGTKAIRLFKAGAGGVFESSPGSNLPPRRTFELDLLTWMASVSTSALFTAVAVVALFDLAVRLGATMTGALFAAVTYGFATPTWGWATAFFGHAVAGALLVVGLWLVVKGTSRPPGQRSRAVLCESFLSGLALGWAVVVEYTALIAAVFVVLYALWRIRHWPWRLLGAVVIAGVAGGMVAGVLLIAYNTALFGSPFSIGYAYVSGFEGMQRGFFGIALPRAEILWEILFGQARGLFWLSPLLLLVPLAWYRLASAGKAPLLLLCLAVVAAYFAINAGYYYWEGGDSTGPRHVTAAMPFLALPFAWMWSEKGRLTRLLLVAFLGASIALNFVAATTNITSPRCLDTTGPCLQYNALLDYLLPNFLAGQDYRIVLGEIGLSVALKLTVYCLILVTLAVVLLWSVARARGESSYAR